MSAPTHIIVRASSRNPMGLEERGSDDGAWDPVRARHLGMVEALKGVLGLEGTATI